MSMSTQQVFYVQPVQKPFSVPCLQCGNNGIVPFPAPGTNPPAHAFTPIGGKVTFCNEKCEEVWKRENLDAMIQKHEEFIQKVQASLSILKDYKATEVKVKELVDAPTFQIREETQPWPEQKLNILFEANMDARPQSVKKPKPDFDRAPKFGFGQTKPDFDPATYVPPPGVGCWGSSTTTTPVSFSLDYVTRQLGLNPGFSRRAIPILKEQIARIDPSSLLKIPPLGDERETAVKLVTWANGTDQHQLDCLVKIIQSFYQQPSATRTDMLKNKLLRSPQLFNFVVDALRAHNHALGDYTTPMNLSSSMTTDQLVAFAENFNQVDVALQVFKTFGC